MIHARKKIFAVFAMLAILACAVMPLSACRIGNASITVTGAFGGNWVFKIGETSCSVKEARLYLVNYQNIYGTAYGLDLWENDLVADSLEQYVKDVTLDQLTRVVCMDMLADSLEISLTEKDSSLVDTAASAYFSSLSDEEADYLDVDQGDISEYYSHYALAQKVYNELTEEVNREVSDDEARVMEIMQIFVTDTEKAEEVREKLSDGEDFASVAYNYNELPNIQVTVARDDLPAEAEAVAFSLDDGAVSDMITTDDGYYFIKCLNKYEEELTEANKANIVAKRQTEAFDDVYEAFVETLESSLNEDVWNGLDVDLENGCGTDSFFETFSKYCGSI